MHHLDDVTGLGLIERELKTLPCASTGQRSLCEGVGVRASLVVHDEGIRISAGARVGAGQRARCRGDIATGRAATGGEQDRCEQANQAKVEGWWQVL